MRVFMKRITAVTVLVIMTVTLAAGCQKKEKPQESETDKKTETTQKTEKKEEKKEEVPYEPGVVTESGFESKWMNLRFVLPENFTMASQEEMQQMFSLGAEQLQLGEKQKEIMEQTGLVYDMMAINAVDSSNVNMLTEKLMLASMSEETYLKTAQEVVKSSAEGASYVISDQITDETLGGQTFKKGSMSVDIQGLKLNQDLYVKKVDSHIVAITISYTDSAVATKDIMVNAFQPY